MKTKLVVLDNNGTMLDDLHLAYGSVQAIFSVLGVPCPTLEQYRTEISCDFMQFYWSHGIPRDVAGEQLQVIRKLYYRMRRATATYREDLRPALERCREFGLTLAVCSAEISFTLLEHLSGAGLLEFFTGRIKGEAWPGKETKLRELLAETGVAPGEAVMIGDTAEDILQARAVGMQTIAFSHPTAYNRYPKLKAAHPDHIIMGFSDLPGLVL